MLVQVPGLERAERYRTIAVIAGFGHDWRLRTISMMETAASV